MSESESETESPILPPLVTVITTCFNQEDVIGDAIKSVLAQETGETNARVFNVICDDGSTDNSPAILQKYAEENPERIRIVTVTNRHLAGALNAALLAVPPETEFVVTLGGDDWLADNFVGECLRAVGDADAVVPLMIHYANPHHKYDEKLKVRKLHPTLEQIWDWDVTYAYGVAFFRRSRLIEVGGFHPFVGGNCDWDMWIDFVAHGYKFAYTDKTWFYYRYSAGSMNHRQTREGWDRQRQEMRRHHRRTGRLPGPEWPN